METTTLKYGFYMMKRLLLFGGLCQKLSQGFSDDFNADELTKYRRLLLFHCRCSSSVGQRSRTINTCRDAPTTFLSTRSPSFLWSTSAFLAPSPTAGCLLGLLVAVAMRGTGPEEGERSGELVSVCSVLEDCSLGTNTLD